MSEEERKQEGMRRRNAIRESITQQIAAIPGDEWVSYDGGDDLVLDGRFKADELRALAAVAEDAARQYAELVAWYEAE